MKREAVQDMGAKLGLGNKKKIQKHLFCYNNNRRAKTTTINL